MRVSDEIAEVIKQRTCQIPCREIVRRERMNDGVQVGLGYPSSAQPAGMIKQPGSPPIEGGQLATSKRFPKAKSSRDWVSSPPELS